MPFDQLTYSKLSEPTEDQQVFLNQSNIVICMRGNFKKILRAVPLKCEDQSRGHPNEGDSEFTLLSDKANIRSILSLLANTVESDITGPAGAKALPHHFDHEPTPANIKDADPPIVGSGDDQITQGSETPADAVSYLLRRIEGSSSMRDLSKAKDEIPAMIRDMMNNGANARSLTGHISTLNDAIVRKVIAFTIAKIGPAPTPYVFMALGSEGRSEQTLSTDQDNAIIYKDIFSGRNRVRSYFMRFGKMVCTYLHELGYHYCIGEVMAQNPKWCQPLSVWKRYFSEWIHTADAKHLLHASIFFDCRAVYGDLQITNELRKHLFGALSVWPGFFTHLAENALSYKPPSGNLSHLGFLLKGKKPNAIDIKSALTPIVDLVRVYALKHGIRFTNTWDRIDQLLADSVFSPRDSEEILKAYTTLMELRLMSQLASILDNRTTPDNYIQLKSITNIERAMIKEIFKQEKNYQNKMKFTFVGAC